MPVTFFIEPGYNSKTGWSGDSDIDIQ